MIDIAKKYRTRDGREVTGLSITQFMAFPLMGYVNKQYVTWTREGKYSLCNDNALDLIEVTEQPDTELDELRAFRDAAIAKYPDLALVDPIEAEVERIYQDFVDNKIITGVSAIRVALKRGIEIGKGEK